MTYHTHSILQIGNTKKFANPGNKGKSRKDVEADKTALNQLRLDEHLAADEDPVPHLDHKKRVLRNRIKVLLFVF